MPVHGEALLPGGRVPLLLHVVRRLAMSRRPGVPRMGGGMTTRESSWSLWQGIREWPWDEKERPRPREFAIPAPEISSRDGFHAPIPKTAVRLARAAAGKDWTVRIACARGPLLHSTQDKVLRTVDSVAVRMTRGGQHAVGLWVDGKFHESWAWQGGDGLVVGGAAEVLEYVKRGDG